MSLTTDDMPGLGLLEGLNKEQREAVTTTNGPVLIVAGPGSGKTRVLTTRVAYLIEERDVAPWNILALTFTNKAAREMKERVANLVGDRARWITMGTFHSFSARVLRQYGQEIGIDPRFVIYDDSDQMSVVKSAMEQVDLSTKQFSPRGVLSTISRAKSHNIGPRAFIDSVETYWEEVVARVYPVYQQTLSLRKALDFDDLLSDTLRLLRESELARRQLQERYQYVLVDEYQDTNHLQYLIVNELSREHRNICVVGDPDQSIYGWRAADIRNILTFNEDYPDATVIHLEENYRSTPEILSAADGVISENTQRIDRALRTSREAGERLIIRECIDEQYEARFIADEILRLQSQEGYSGNQIAVLYRTNAQSRTVEEALIRSGIPYQLIGGTRFYERREIKDVMAMLRLLANPDDLGAFERVLDAFPIGEGIGAKTVASLDEWSRTNRQGLSTALAMLDKPGGPAIASRGRTLLRNVRDTFSNLRALEPAVPLSELFDRALDDTGYMTHFTSGDPEMLERWDNVLQLRSTVEQFDDVEPEMRLTTFLEEVALVSDADTLEEDLERVTLITLHAVKGLEFDVVFISGAEEGLIPHYRALTDDPASIEEERRLFYVGITRARDRLYITHAFRRSRFGFSDVSTPSPFLAAIPPDVLGDPPTREPARRKRSASGLFTIEDQPLEVPKYEEGQRVFHNKFGDGVVLSVEDKPNDQELVVDFKRHGQKRLIASFANLTTD